MYQKLINDYLKKITIQDILDYAKKKEININEKEVQILLYYAKNYTQELIDGDTRIFQEIKNSINKEAYKQIYKLYIEAKIKYLS